MDACSAGEIRGDIRLVISNKPYAYGLTRAKKAGIETMVFEPGNYPTRTEMCSEMTEALTKSEIDLICLAGYMLKIEPCMLRSFPEKILNIHPALLPKFGGPGMFGRHVHEAVLKAQEKKSGCTVHVVDEHFDHGPILAQETVPVKPEDTAETLAERIHPKEHALYVSVVKQICEGKIEPGRSKS